MEQGAASAFVAWRAFYAILGESAAALTGLQFVVIVLGAQVNVLGSVTTQRAFGTPTIVHFCVALLVSAVISAPWNGALVPGIGLAVCGGAGIVYALVVIGHARRQTSYAPVLEDWIWHGALPLVAYASLLVGGILLAWRPEAALFVIGSTAVLLLFIGIHNAWDSVTFLSLARQRREETSGEK